MKHITLFTALLISCSFSLSAQTVYYVKQGASGASDGSSWANAFTRFQQALAVAQDGDEIWIAKGTYKPTTSNDRFAFYDLPSGVQVFGGFAGIETQRNQRDWTAHPTILSGDIGTPGDSTDNSFNILYSYSPNENTRLDGLIFEEGNANNISPAVDSHRPTRSGGGIYLDGEHFGYAQLSVANCIFRRNRADYQGGGIYANGREGGMAIVRLENCLFERNISNYYGGGFSQENYFEQPFALEIKGCEFRENYAFTGGIAVWLRANQPVTFTNCEFYRHRSILGSTVAIDQTISNYPLVFNNCLFHKNSNTTIRYSPVWSQATNDASFKFNACSFSENGLPTVFAYLNTATKVRAAFENCLFVFNKYSGASANGYLITLGGTPDAEGISITNCLFYKNAAQELGVSSANVNNSIFIEDDITNNPLKGIFWGNGPFNITNSLFHLPDCNSLGGFLPNNPIIHCDSSNIFSADPLFINPFLGANTNFHLQPCSPAINAGTNAILDSLGITTDLEGNPRVRNGVVDMGPYEQHISLNPSTLAQPACAGASDGAVGFDADICPPYSFSWSNGVTTGTQTDGLAAGTYVFTAIGSNNIPVTDTIVINEPLPLEVFAEGHDVTCAGSPNGWVEASATGGTTPYQYYWEPLIPSVPTHFNLPAGAYFLTVTDAKGCTGTAKATIGSHDPIQVFYTVHNTTCLGCSDGSVVFDSITGGVNPVLPPPMLNLPVGHYCFTITDAVACQAVVCFNVLATSGTSETALESLVKLNPNPTAIGETALLEWSGQEKAMVRVLDLQGRVLDQQSIPENASIRLATNWLSGIYLIEIRTDSGKITRRLWSIF